MTNPKHVLNNIAKVTKEATEALCIAATAAMGMVRKEIAIASAKITTSTSYREAARQICLMVDRATLESYIGMPQNKEKQDLLKNIPNLFVLREAYYNTIADLAGSKTAKAAAYKKFNTDILKTYCMQYFTAEDAKLTAIDAAAAVKVAKADGKSKKVVNRLVTLAQDAVVIAERDRLKSIGKRPDDATKQAIEKVENKQVVKTDTGFYADIQEAVKAHRELGKHAKRDTALFLAILPRLYEHKVCEKPVPVEHDVANP